MTRDAAIGDRLSVNDHGEVTPAINGSGIIGTCLGVNDDGTIEVGVDDMRFTMLAEKIQTGVTRDGDRVHGMMIVRSPR